MLYEMFEGDYKELSFDVPSEFIGGTATLLIDLGDDICIRKDVYIESEKVIFKLIEANTLTRIGIYPMEVRLKKDDKAKVLNQGKLMVQNSIIIRTEMNVAGNVAMEQGDIDDGSVAIGRNENNAVPAAMLLRIID